MSKKGFIFSVIAVFIVLIFFLFSKITNIPSRDEGDISSTQLRVMVLNDLVGDLEDRYFEKMLYISARNALEGLAEYRNKTPTPRTLPVPCEPCNLGSHCGPEKCPKPHWTLKDDFTTVLLKGIILDNVADYAGQGQVKYDYNNDGTAGDSTNSYGDGIWDVDDNCTGVKNNPLVDDFLDDPHNPGNQNETFCRYFPNDLDGDGVRDAEDNCPRQKNPDQKPSKIKEGIGEFCEQVCSQDSDKDGICNEKDSCPNDFDPYNLNKDQDQEGDACESGQPSPDSLYDEDIYAPLITILEKQQGGSSGGYNPELSMLALVNRLERAMQEFDMHILQLGVEEGSLSLVQLDPWVIEVNATFNYYLQDNERIASWKGSTTKSVRVNIMGLLDPATGMPVNSSYSNSGCAHTCESYLGRLSKKEETLNPICLTSEECKLN